MIDLIYCEHCNRQCEKEELKIVVAEEDFISGEIIRMNLCFNCRLLAEKGIIWRDSDAEQLGLLTGEIEK